jgi:hypothetical protein
MYQSAKNCIRWGIEAEEWEAGKFLTKMGAFRTAPFFHAPASGAVSSLSTPGELYNRTSDKGVLQEKSTSRFPDFWKNSKKCNRIPDARGAFMALKDV